MTSVKPTSPAQSCGKIDTNLFDQLLNMDYDADERYANLSPSTYLDFASIDTISSVKIEESQQSASGEHIDRTSTTLGVEGIDLNSLKE